MKQFILTTAAAKRLIARGIAARPDIIRVLKSGTLVIIAGTTNGYVAEEILKSLDQVGAFSRKRFFRGVTLPPGYKRTEAGRLPDESVFPGDVVIRNGEWLKGKTIDDVAPELVEGDIILKGANALDVNNRRAAVLIGSNVGGTVIATVQAAVGRRVKIIIPVGLEKRIEGSLDRLAERLNEPEATGPRLLPVPGEVFTELDALRLLSGVDCELMAAGGVSGAEGCVWILAGGEAENEWAAENVVSALDREPGFLI